MSEDNLDKKIKALYNYLNKNKLKKEAEALQLICNESSIIKEASGAASGGSKIWKLIKFLTFGPPVGAGQGGLMYRAWKTRAGKITMLGGPAAYIGYNVIENSISRKLIEDCFANPEEEKCKEKIRQIKRAMCAAVVSTYLNEDPDLLDFSDFVQGGYLSFNSAKGLSTITESLGFSFEGKWPKGLMYGKQDLGTSFDTYLMHPEGELYDHLLSMSNMTSWNQYDPTSDTKLESDNSVRIGKGILLDAYIVNDSGPTNSLYLVVLNCGTYIDDMVNEFNKLTKQKDPPTIDTPKRLDIEQYDKDDLDEETGLPSAYEKWIAEERKEMADKVDNAHKYDKDGKKKPKFVKEELKQKCFVLDGEEMRHLNKEECDFLYERSPEGGPVSFMGQLWEDWTDCCPEPIEPPNPCEVMNEYTLCKGVFLREIDSPNDKKNNEYIPCCEEYRDQFDKEMKALKDKEEVKRRFQEDMKREFPDYDPSKQKWRLDQKDLP